MSLDSAIGEDQMTLEIKIFGPGDEELLKNVALGVFDNAVNQKLSTEFLNDAAIASQSQSNRVWWSDLCLPWIMSIQTNPPSFGSMNWLSFHHINAKESQSICFRQS